MIRPVSFVTPLLVGVAVCLTAVPAMAQADGRRWALLVGVNDYANLEDLRFACADMVALRKQLIDSGFRDERVVLLHDGADQAKFRPVRANIEKQLNLLLRLVKPDDLVLVAFSGHGVFINGASYLCPSEADLDNPTATLVKLDGPQSVYDQLRGCDAAIRLLMVDACRNQVVPRANKAASDPNLLKGVSETLKHPPQGVLLLSSCIAGQMSKEDEKLGHGVFMHYVLKGLRGEADQDKNGQVSLAELSGYAAEETELYVVRQFNDAQNPFLQGELTGRALRFSLSVGKAEPKGGEIVTNSIGMKLVVIPAGEFEMGADESKTQLKDAGFYISDTFDPGDESPVHRVQVSRPFYLGQTEVTVGQFRKFVADEMYLTEAERDGKGGWGYNIDAQVAEQKPHFNWKNTGFAQTDDHPVVNVTWNDAMAFCEWLTNKEDGAMYRLPTEAEWEYACRANTKSRYWTGDKEESLADAGNFWDQSSRTKYPKVDKVTFLRFDDGWAFSAPVGRFKASSFGLHDMHGNVWEWCQEYYDPRFYDRSPPADPVNTRAAPHRIYRGGGWNSNAIDCRSAVRLGSGTDYRLDDLGFRVARSHRPR